MWQSEHSPFGQQTAEAGLEQHTATYTGKDFDEDAGLYYFNARWFRPGRPICRGRQDVRPAANDAELGRFVTLDPARDGSNCDGQDGLIPTAPWMASRRGYAYVRNNPLGYVVPTGLAPDTFGQMFDAQMRIIGLRKGRDSYTDFDWYNDAWGCFGSNGELRPPLKDNADQGFSNRIGFSSAEKTAKNLGFRGRYLTHSMFTPKSNSSATHLGNWFGLDKQMHSDLSSGSFYGPLRYGAFASYLDGVGVGGEVSVSSSHISQAMQNGLHYLLGESAPGFEWTDEFSIDAGGTLAFSQSWGRGTTGFGVASAGISAGLTSGIVLEAAIGTELPLITTGNDNGRLSLDFTAWAAVGFMKEYSLSGMPEFGARAAIGGGVNLQLPPAFGKELGDFRLGFTAQLNTLNPSLSNVMGELSWSTSTQ